jgi:hypothetical protein
MEDRLKSVSSSLSLNAVDTRDTYYSLNQNDNLNFTSLPNAATAATNFTTTNALCMLVNGHRVQQRYKLLTDGLVQVCRVPHARNIIEKIRFSRFLRRWEDHYINLAHNEILSETVRCFFFINFYIKILIFSRVKVIWIDQYFILQ